MTKQINTAIGYVFLAVGTIGCAAFLSFIFGFNFSNVRTLYTLFGPGNDGGASLSPVFVALISAIGAYLVKE